MNEFGNDVSLFGRNQRESLGSNRSLSTRLGIRASEDLRQQLIRGNAVEIGQIPEALQGKVAFAPLVSSQGRRLETTSRANLDIVESKAALLTRATQNLADYF
jgi:hypothetical protein